MRRLALLLPLIAVATLHATDPALPPLVFDQGAAGAWQKILKLQTTASVLHTTAHPDDEHSGVLTMLSRGLGARTALLTINRGEAGDNAIGPELFDALGLIRTDELARAGQYYGLDEQYFTQVADYGFSKRLDEAMTEWDRAATAARHGARHPAIPPARRRVALARQRARRAWPASGRRRAHADGGRRGGGSGAVPGARRREPAAVAGSQAVCGRRARERAVARADGNRRVRSGARRLVQQRRPRGPEPAALANQRPLEPDARGRRRCSTRASTAARRRERVVAV